MIDPPVLDTNSSHGLTRPKPAYDRQGLDWIVGPEYSFRVFSMSRFTPAVLSSVELIIFRDRYLFLIQRGPNGPDRHAF